ncbi:hypothetical protein PS639_05425 [Pseudomonas fluorescens]|nr:hypothetical protein PS639_05425 [Pseudomonas fluorescens]
MNLRLQGVDVARDLATEGVEFGGRGALRRTRTIVLLALEHNHVLFQTVDGSARVALLLQCGDVGAEAFQLNVNLAGVGRGTFQRGQFTVQRFDLRLQLGVGALMFSVLGDHLRQSFVQLGVLGGHLRQSLIQLGSLRSHLRQALVQLGGLAGDTLLLPALVLKFAFQLFDLQFQGFAVAADVGLAGDHLAGNVLQAPRRVLADTGEAFLSRHQLLFHQRDLLKAPPGKAGERKEQGANQRPQRAGARTFDLGHGRWARTHRVASGGHKIIVVEAVGTQARYIVEVVVGIVTHGH